MFKDITQRPLPEGPGEADATRRPLLQTPGKVRNNVPAMLEAGEPNFSRAEFRLTPFHTWFHSLKSPLGGRSPAGPFTSVQAAPRQG